VKITIAPFVGLHYELIYVGAFEIFVLNLLLCIEKGLQSFISLLGGADTAEFIERKV
jgi:hypothetical protein